MRRVGIGMIESRVGGQRGFLVPAAIVTEMEGGFTTCAKMSGREWRGVGEWLE